MEVCPVDKPMGDRGVTENYTAPAVRSTDQLDVMKNEPSVELANAAVIYRKPPAGLGDPPGWTGSGHTAGDPTAPAVAAAPTAQPAQHHALCNHRTSGCLAQCKSVHLFL